MASRTVKHKKTICNCVQVILNALDSISQRQNILMDGHILLTEKINNLSLWTLIKNCFKRKKS